MKYFVLLLVTAFFSYVPTSRAAEGDHSVGLMVGQVWPSGDLGQDIEGAVAPGLFYEYAASDVFSVFAEGLRSTHSSDALKMNTYAVGIRSVLIYIDKLAPYAFLGMGLYDVERMVGSAREVASKTLFGFNLGIGADLDLSEQAFVGMGFQLHNIFSGSVDLPVQGRYELSGRWSGLFLRGGFRF